MALFMRARPALLLLSTSGKKVKVWCKQDLNNKEQRGGLSCQKSLSSETWSNVCAALLDVMEEPQFNKEAQVCICDVLFQLV